MWIDCFLGNVWDLLPFPACCSGCCGVAGQVGHLGTHSLPCHGPHSLLLWQNQSRTQLGTQLRPLHAQLVTACCSCPCAQSSMESQPRSALLQWWQLSAPLPVPALSACLWVHCIPPWFHRDVSPCSDVQGLPRVGAAWGLCVSSSLPSA